jgi:hypothetical protein
MGIIVKAGTNDITNMASEYWNVVNSLIGEKKTVDNNKKKTKAKKPKIPVPFYGTVEDGWCCGIKKNHGLYTQCCKPRPKDGDYCKGWHKRYYQHGVRILECSKFIDWRKENC